MVRVVLHQQNYSIKNGRETLLPTAKCEIWQKNITALRQDIFSARISWWENWPRNIIASGKMLSRHDFRGAEIA